MFRAKEFGQEIYFRTDRAMIKDNRYSFELPLNWAAQYKRDPVISISEIYYTQCIRDIRYQFKLELINQTLGMFTAIPEYTITINGIYYMSRNIMFRNFCKWIR